MAHLLHFVVGFALLLHAWFWGAGAALLAMPRPWRRFWPVLAMAFGFALQSAAVWAGAHAGLRGTDSYARIAEILPLALLAAGMLRHGVRASWTDVSRFGLVWLAMAGTLLALIAPLAFASKGLTTISLGSCDAADYAAGARVLQQFARGDREGFLGLVEVVRVMSVDNFFDYWLRLNHFTPSALIALNGTIFDCQPHELTSLLTMVLQAGTLPLVFWIARAVVGYSGGVSLGVAILYGASPLMWYAVGHVAPGQLLAAQAIALLTWMGVALWRGRLTVRRARQFLPVGLAGYWLVLGSYNFILLLCLVPAAAYAGGRALWLGKWQRFAGWAGAMIAPLGLVILPAWTRVAGLAERLTLFRTYDFGWRIPALGPEGWLGMVSGPGLQPWDFFGLRWVLAAVAGVALAWALHRTVRQRAAAAWLVAALAGPVLAGYAYLQWRGARLGTNASYDAYKLFAVFYPLLLPAFCWWVTLRRSRRLTEWFGVVALASLVLAFNLLGTAMFAWRLARPPLLVDAPLRELRKIEAMPDVASLNLFVPDMWSRLWANAFLLRKPQYFLTHTYEGRLNTPLRGEWDLQGGVLQVRTPGGATKEIAGPYRLSRAESRAALTADFGPGWHAEEQAPGARWRWSMPEATLWLDNPGDRSLAVKLSFDWRALHEAEVRIEAPGPSGAAAVAVARTRASFTPALIVPPGRTAIRLILAGRTESAAGDERPLGVCAYGITVEVLPEKP